MLIAYRLMAKFTRNNDSETLFSDCSSRCIKYSEHANSKGVHTVSFHFKDGSGIGFNYLSCTVFVLTSLGNTSHAN